MDDFVQKSPTIKTRGSLPRNREARLPAHSPLTAEGGSAFQTPSTRSALAKVSSAKASADIPRSFARNSQVCAMNAGSFGCPLIGTGARNGESVSMRMRSSGMTSAEARTFSAGLNVTIPEIEM